MKFREVKWDSQGHLAKKKCYFGARWNLCTYVSACQFPLTIHKSWFLVFLSYMLNLSLENFSVFFGLSEPARTHTHTNPQQQSSFSNLNLLILILLNTLLPLKSLWSKRTVKMSQGLGNLPSWKASLFSDKVTSFVPHLFAE